MSILKRVLSRLLRISSRRKDIDESVAEGLLKGFEWVDGEEAEAEEEPMPMFYVGDSVNLYSPYEGEFISQDFFAMEPERYEIDGVDYDHKQKVFRYSLKGQVDELDGRKLWYSEEWLSLPVVSSFVSKKIIDEPEGSLLMQKGDLEDRILSRSIEEDLREREIDRFLDIMRNGTAEERRQAEEELRRITSEEGGER